MGDFELTISRALSTSCRAKRLVARGISYFGMFLPLQERVCVLMGMISRIDKQRNNEVKVTRARASS
jgi:hypothetical protein